MFLAYVILQYIKSKVYKARPANTDDLKQQIRDNIGGIPKEILPL
jgi:hypothetical protein